MDFGFGEEAGQGIAYRLAERGDTSRSVEVDELRMAAVKEALLLVAMSPCMGKE